MRKKELIFDKKFAIKVWNIEQDEFPEVLIIQGQRVVERNLQYAEEKLFGSSRRLNVGDVIIGSLRIEILYLLLGLVLLYWLILLISVFCWV